MPKGKANQQKKQQQKQQKQEKKQQCKKPRKNNRRGQAKKSSGYKQHFQEFQDQMNKLGLFIRDVEGDGNCLFRSIADIMDGTENTHKSFRRFAVEAMRQNQEFYQNFIEDDMSFEQFLREMEQDGEWGGHLELQALAEAMHVNFIIHMKGRPAMILTSMMDGMNRKESLLKKQSIHLAYHLVENIAEHYSAVRLKNDDTYEMARPIPLDIFHGLQDQLEEFNENQFYDDNYDEVYYNQENNNFQEEQNNEEIDDEEEWLRQQIAEIQLQEAKLDTNSKNNKCRKSKKELQQEDEERKRKEEEERKKEEEQKVKENLKLKQKKNQKCKCGSKKTYKDCCLKKQFEQEMQQKQKQNQNDDQDSNDENDKEENKQSIIFI